MSNYNVYGYATKAWNPLIPTFSLERLSEPEKWLKPQVVACNFTGDWMDMGHKPENIANVFQVAEYYNQHTFLTLTKRPLLLWRFTNEYYSLELPKNLWLGLPITNQRDAEEKLPIFLQIPGKKWLNIDPCMSEIDLPKAITGRHSGIIPDKFSWFKSHSIDQVVLGGMSGPKATPLHPDWVRKVRDDCAAAGVPFFFKQWGKYKPIHFNTVQWESSRRNGDIIIDTNTLAILNKTKSRLLDGREHNELAWAND